MKALRSAVQVCLLLLLISVGSASAATVTLSGSIQFSSLDGSAQDNDGIVNGIFTVNDDLVLDGTINCNDDPPLPGNASACQIRLAVSGNVSLTAGSGIFAENRIGGGDGGKIVLTAGGDIILHGPSGALTGAVVSSGRTTGTSHRAGDITLQAGGGVEVEAGSAVSAGAHSGRAGDIVITAGDRVTVAGLIAAGPSRVVLASSSTGKVLDGGSSKQEGGSIVIRAQTSSEPGLRVEAGGIVVSQGEKGGAQVVRLEGCGVEVSGLVAVVAKKDGPGRVVLRSGTTLLIDGRDLGTVGPRQGRVRADSTEGGAAGFLVDLFAGSDIQVLGPAASPAPFAVSSTPGAEGPAGTGGTVTVISLAGTLTGSGNAFAAGRSRLGNRGGTIDLRAKGAVALDGATLQAVGDFATTTSSRKGGRIMVRSYQADVSWTFGTGDVRPTGTGVSAANRGTITLTACSGIDLTGSQFPVVGSPVLPFPVENDGVCSPSAPVLPAGEPPLPVCNNPPVANNDAATVAEDAPATAIPVLANDTDTEGDPFAIQSVTQPANGTVVITGGGTGLTYQPNANYCNTPPGTTLDTFTYTLTPGGATATVTVTVTCVNDNPVAVADSATVAEDSSATAVNVLANDTDAENDPFTIQSVTQPANGTVVITGGGTGLTYQPNADYCNTPLGTTLDTFTYTLTPGGSSTTVTMTVTCADDDPVAVNDSATVAEDSGANAVNVLANDTDVDGGAISITSVTQPANGTVVITGGGTGLTYAPNANYCNTPPGTTLDTFTYTLTPGGSSATVTVTVTCVDDNPVAVNDSATVAEDSGASAVNVLANDTDADGGPISITSVTQPANGAVVITGGGTGLTYQPNANYCNSVSGVPDTFTYTLTPGGSSATVTVTVTCVDDDPSAVADAATVSEDSGANAIAVLANDTDPDGGAISITSVTQPTNGAVVITGGGTGLTYQPNANYCNSVSGVPDTFTYTLTPGGSSTTVTVTVTCVDDAPAAVADAATVNEDSGANPINVLANDIDVDAGPISVTAVTQPANGAVAITNGGADLTYTPNADYCNSVSGVPDTFTYTLAPGGSSTTVTVTVTCLADGPVIDLDANDNQGTGGSNFAVTFTEGDPATLIEDPLDATVMDVDSGTLASLTVTITNLLDTGNETLSTDVTGTSIIASYAVTPGTGTLTLTGPDTLANFQTVLRRVRYVNTDNSPDTTPRVIHFVANDGTADGNTAVSTVTVVSSDTNPTAVNDTATVNEGSGANAIDVLANDTDPDGGAISITSVTQPTNGTVVITGGGTGLTYQPTASYCNSVSGVPDTFTYTLTPGGSTATVSVTVTCVDDNPVAVADAVTVVEDSTNNAIDVLANDTDADGGTKLIQSVTQPANGTVVITGGGTGLTYTPNANYCNSVSGVPDTFTYTLTPGGSTATVSVTVTCVDDNPVTVADAATVVEDSANNAIDVLANDTDADGGTKLVQSVTQPTNGAVVITGGGTGVTYTSNANYCNSVSGVPDTFTYTLTPGGSSTTVTVTVTCVDDPPTAVADSATVNEDSGANAISVLANDTDPDAGPISITSVTQPANGTVAITGGGTGLTYAPNANFCNNPPGATLETFTYTLTPGGSSTTVTVTVTCVNDPPVADNDAFDFIGNTELVVDLPALATPHARETTGTTFGVIDGDSDPVENNAIAVSAITIGACTDSSAPFDCSDPAVGRVQMETNGRFTFTPAPGDTGATETFQYTLTDNGLPAPASTTATVTLTRFERVWYVKNDAPAGGNGTSASPFNSITAANLNDNFGDGDLTDDLDSAGDYIFVYFGTGTAANQSGGLVLENNQHLIGQHAGLSLNVNLNGNGAPTNLVTAVVGNRPLLDDTVVDAFEGVAARDVIPAEIVGMNLAGNVNAIDWTTTAAFAGTGAFSIRDTVIRSAANEGVDINLAGTGATRLAFHDNNLTSIGTGLDIQETGTGALTITAFDDNVVSGNTGGSGIIVSNAVFDSVLGGGLDTVNGGTTVIGASGNGVGGAGMALGNVQGDLHFTGNLNIFADGGAGLTVSGTGAGFQLRVNSGGAPTGIVEATGGPAVDANTVGLDLRLTSLRSTNSASTGTSLTNVNGTFSAETGSSITNSAGTDFAISGGTANVTYKGTITDDVGQLVSVSGATAGTKSFEGAITDGDDGDGNGVSLSSNGGATVRFSGGLLLSTGASAAFAATGGGTVEVCDENPCNGAATGGLINKITTTTATALNVANTNIGAGNLEFRSISSNGGSSAGIIVNTTGTSGGLKVKGNGGAGTGGMIANKTGSDGSTTTGLGIYLNSTSSTSLAWMQLNDFENFAIRGNNVTGFTLTNTVINALDGSPLNGTAQGEGGVGEGSIRFDNLIGTVTISDSTITHGVYDNVGIFNTNTSVALNLTVSNTTFATTTTTNTGNDALRIEIDDTVAGAPQTQANIVIQGDCDFTASRGDLLDVIAQRTTASAVNAAVVDLDVIGNDFSNNHSSIASGGGGVIFHGQGNMTFIIEDNDLKDARGRALNLSKGATAGVFSGRINNNRIGVAGSAFSGSDEASGIYVDGGGAGNMTVAITNNQVRRTNEAGIFIVANNQSISGNNATLNATITGNVVAEPESALSFAGLWVDIGTGVSGDTSTACVDIGGVAALANDFSTGDPFNGGDINLAVQSGSTFRLPGYGGANNNDGQITSYLTGRNSNPGTTTVSLSHTGTMTSNPGVCVQP